MHLWRDRLDEMIAERPVATEDDITWQLIEEMAVKALGAPAAGLRT